MACRPLQERADTRLREQTALAERATKQEKVKETLLEQLRREAEQRRFQVLSSVYLLCWYKAQILTPEELLPCQEAAAGDQLTCFTGTTVQILTPPEELRGRRRPHCRLSRSCENSLLALLVHKYKY